MPRGKGKHLDISDRGSEFSDAEGIERSAADPSRKRCSIYYSAGRPRFAGLVATRCVYPCDVALRFSIKQRITSYPHNPLRNQFYDNLKTVKSASWFW